MNWQILLLLLVSFVFVGCGKTKPSTAEEAFTNSEQPQTSGNPIGSGPGYNPETVQLQGIKGIEGAYRLRASYTVEDRAAARELFLARLVTACRSLNLGFLHLSDLHQGKGQEYVANGYCFAGNVRYVLGVELSNVKGGALVDKTRNPLRKGDVIIAVGHQQVRNPAQVAREVYFQSEIKQRNAVRLRIERGSSVQAVVVGLVASANTDINTIYP